MRRTIKPRPNTPPIEPPIIAGVLFDSLCGFTRGSGGIVGGGGTKPSTVESGRLARLANCIANVGENESIVTTSR